MFQQPVVVHYADGSEKPVVLTQWSIGQFGQYAAKQGWKVDPQQPGLLSVTMIRFQAYCELHRDPTGARPTFDKWDMTVNEVEPLTEAQPEDPTQTAPSDG